MAFMFDMVKDFQQFYDVHVRLGAERRKDLAKKRDLNLDRLKGGLDELAAEKNKPHPHFQYTTNQGGYAMHTLNQDPEGRNTYDIDVAVVFNKADLPDGPLAARQRVRDALLKKCGNFADVPEARTNAVTIWYGEGYHIDFAVYRQWTDILGRTVLEHASTEWKSRDPDAVTEWFTKTVTDLSPKASPALGYYPKVAEGQFRRIVRLVKWFCRSRSGWSLPGGMVISNLLADGVYKSNPDRDDRAFYDTLVALRDRTAYNTKVYSKVDGADLTGKSEYENQVKHLHKHLKKHVPKLDILFDQANCTRAKARSAWDWIFNHPFWADAEKVLAKSSMESTSVGFPNTVSVKCELSRKEDKPAYAEYASDSSLLRKGIYLTFSVKNTNVPLPYEVEWQCSNEGDEAEDNHQEAWTQYGSTAKTSTKFKGRHKMRCIIKRGGIELARADHIVRIAAGPFGKRY